jgi:hypothetical protein
VTVTAIHFEPGEYIAWYFGPTQFRGHVQKILRGGEEVIVISTTGVRWNLFPSQTQIQHLPPTDLDWMRAIR